MSKGLDAECTDTTRVSWPCGHRLSLLVGNYDGWSAPNPEDKCPNERGFICLQICYPCWNQEHRLHLPYSCDSMNHILFLPIHCIYQADLWLRQSSGRALLPVEMVCNHAVTKLKKHTNNTNARNIKKASFLEAQMTKIANLISFLSTNWMTWLCTSCETFREEYHVEGVSA